MNWEILIQKVIKFDKKALIPTTNEHKSTRIMQSERVHAVPISVNPVLLSWLLIYSLCSLPAPVNAKVTQAQVCALWLKIHLTAKLPLVTIRKLTDS